jgi:hypothetical protein
MRPLVIDEETRAKVCAVEEFAYSNWYRPGQSELVPGDDPRHTVLLNTYRCVFSYTKMRSELFRHLSVSVPSAKYPHPYAVWTIAELFGFTGWDGKSPGGAPDWLAQPNKEEHCITVAQKNHRPGAWADLAEPQKRHKFFSPSRVVRLEVYPTSSFKRHA